MKVAVEAIYARFSSKKNTAKELPNPMKVTRANFREKLIRTKIFVLLFKMDVVCFYYETTSRRCYKALNTWQKSKAI